MKLKTIAFLSLALLPFSSPAQDSLTDGEQEQLSLCYNYSKILGCEIDSISQPELFKTVYECLGTPYHYSGDTKEGIDCSGFVCMLYKKVYNMELAGSSKEIFSENIKQLKGKDLDVGDLLFFKIRKHRISHVGIYLGNNKFAHASSHEGVIISDLREPYYKKYFYKAGRIKKSSGEKS